MGYYEIVKGVPGGSVKKPKKPKKYKMGKQSHEETPPKIQEPRSVLEKAWT